jgi:hypothetical protein
MLFEFEYHDGERWSEVGRAEIAARDSTVHQALIALRSQQPMLPLGVYRVRSLPRGSWQIGELWPSGGFTLDEDVLRSLS